MKELPSDLEKKWREAHHQTSQEAFERVEREGRTAKTGEKPSFFQLSEQKQAVYQ
jgi:hypothetical protein